MKERIYAVLCEENRPCTVVYLKERVGAPNCGVVFQCLGELREEGKADFTAVPIRLDPSVPPPQIRYFAKNTKDQKR